MGPWGLPLINSTVHGAAFTSPGQKWKRPYKMQLETSPCPHGISRDMRRLGLPRV